MFDLVTIGVRPLEDDYIYIYNDKLIHHLCIRCRVFHVEVLQSITKMVGAQPIVDCTETFVLDGLKRKKAY